MGLQFIKNTNETIFVQIAAYRDPELIPTLKDLFDKAHNPDNLKVVVAWQHDKNDEWDNLDEYQDDSRVKILDIPHLDSEGACWARHKIQQEYSGEDYTLQLDSHHRFVEGWDTKCISMLKKLQSEGHDKPLLTSYIPSYHPNNDPDGRVNTPWGMSFDRFIPEGVIFFLPYYLKEEPKPIPGRFYSAHFAFTLGKFCEEVPHDPSFYFHGEEITIAVRAFTHGYDIFHPNEVLAWHEYTREGRTKNWDDNQNWGEQNKITHSKTRQLLGIDGEICTPCNKKAFGKYGLGDTRTLKDYEIYAGIRFSDRSITKECKENTLPGVSNTPEYFQQFKHAIDLNHNDYRLNDYTFCAFIFEDETGYNLHREDMEGPQFLSKVNSAREGNSFTIWKSYQGPKPDRIVVWPHSESKGWTEKRVMKL